MICLNVEKIVNLAYLKWYVWYISKSRANQQKWMWFLNSAPQKPYETVTSYMAPKSLFTNVIDNFLIFICILTPKCVIFRKKVNCLLWKSQEMPIEEYLFAEDAQTAPQ